MWASLPAQQQEAIRSATVETFLRWWARWQKQNADAIDEMRTKHGTQILRTPPDILIAFLKTWDMMAKEESAKSPFFKKVLDSQRAYAAKVVPAKRFMNPAVLVRGQLLLARGQAGREGQEVARIEQVHGEKGRRGGPFSFLSG